jgi:nickel-dependent lactate racemase
MPGVSTRAAIRSNHRFMVEPESAAGRLEGNPVREDIEESGRLCPSEFICNVVLDEHKEIIKCVSGHVVDAHREGCKFLDSLYAVKMEKKADIVIASAGGFPKDRNMYQAQKALDNAAHAVRDGGIIIWIAECSEGLGEKHFEDWMTGHEKASDMIEHIKRDFVLGGHKAAAQSSANRPVTAAPYPLKGPIVATSPAFERPSDRPRRSCCRSNHALEEE